MKHTSFWIVLIFVGVATIFVVSRFVSGGPKEPSREEFALDVKGVEEAVVPDNGSEEEPTYEFEMSEEAGGLTRLTGEGVTIVVPQDWIITAGIGQAPSGDQFINDTREILARLQNVEADEMSDPDVVYMDVERIAKDGRAYSEVLRDWTWIRDDAEAQAKFMRENASAPYNEITADDVVTEAATEELGGQTVDYAYFSCTKPCYSEGGPPTWKRYFFDSADAVYAIVVRAVTSENTEAFLNEAAKIAATFEVK